MFVAALFHLLDVVLVVAVVVAVIADDMPVADVADADDVSGASHWPTALSHPPGDPPFHRLSTSAHASSSWTHYAHGPALPRETRNGELSKTHHALGRAQQC